MAETVCLGIETSNPSAGGGWGGAVALGVSLDWGEERGGWTLLAEEGLAPTGRHDDALAPAIQRACLDAGVTARDLGRVVVSIGPGGFTALRIALATALMLGESLGVEVVGVPSARSAAAAAARGVWSAGRALVTLASKGDTAWGQVFEARADGVRAVTEGALLDAAGASALRDAHAFGVVIGDEHLAGPIREWAEGAGVAVEPPRWSAAALLEASRGRRAEGVISPIYPREPEFVVRWRERGKR